MDMITLAMAKAYADSQRLGYVEKESVEVLPEFTFEVTASADGGYYYKKSGTVDFSAIGCGGRCVCIFDGVQYECVEDGASRFPNVVNIGDFALESTPFLVTYEYGEFYVSTSVAGEHTLSISTPETIHPIDPKYLPGVCLPVVELSEETCTTLFSGTNATLTEAEAAVFTEAKENTLPVFVKVDWNGMKMAVIAGLVVTDTGATAYVADTLASGNIYFRFTDSGMIAIRS